MMEKYQEAPHPHEVLPPTGTAWSVRPSATPLAVPSPTIIENPRWLTRMERKPAETKWENSSPEKSEAPPREQSAIDTQLKMEQLLASDPQMDVT